MTKRYGLIGYPLSHSFSQKYFSSKFSNEKIDARYDIFPLESIHDLMSLLKTNPDLLGLNVTIPYKQDVMALLDEISDEASAVNAVNVIKITRSARQLILKGYNTDAPAFESEVIEFTDNRAGNALILGTGGAAAAVLFSLNKLGWYSSMVSRNPLSGDVLSYDQLDEKIMNSTRLIVNTTPLGMYPDIESSSPIPYNYLTSSHYLFDLVYNPDLTVFLKQGLDRGVKVRNGMGMLHKQADLAWQIWQE